MLVRLRSTLFAWAGALVLAVSATGLVAAATLVSDTTDTQATAPTSTFTDTNGDGIDDACQSAVTADQAAVDAAVKAADANGDGTISVSEAAHTDWTGGPNCNHGGYVSGVAGASGEDAGDTGDAPDGAAPSDKQQPATCDTTPPETPTAPSSDGQAPTDAAPNAHGMAVSTVAQDKTAVGGKNCNHGGAVSQAAKKGHGSGHGLRVDSLTQPKQKGHRWGNGKP